MSILTAVCPRCRTESNTGISADECAMQQLGSTLQVLVLCDHCNEYQKMLVKDLNLAAEEVVA